MRRDALYPFLGPALVLYLLADISSGQAEVDARGFVIAAFSLLLSAALVVRIEDAEEASAGRVRLLSFATALALLRFVVDGTIDFAVDAVALVGMASVGTLCLDLALSTPDVPLPVRSTRLVRAGARLLGLLAAGVSVLALGPALSWTGAPLLLPAVYESAAPLWCSVGITAAFVVRLLRKRLGSTPDALASNAWAVLGLGFAGLFAAAVALRWAVGGLALALDARAFAPVAAIGLSLGRLWMIDPRRRLVAAPWMREVTAAAISSGVLGAAWSALHGRLPSHPMALGIAVAATLLAGLVLLQYVRPLVHRVFSPFGGRLLAELRAIPEMAGYIHGLGGLAKLELLALRRAAGTPEAQPLLFTLDPVGELRIDAAGEVHQREVALHPALLEQLRAAPGEIIVRAPLEARIVRQPRLRPLVQALIDLDVLCVVPLCHEGQLEGALVVPRGTRSAALTLEELGALTHHAGFVSALLAMFCAHARAEARVQQMIVGRDRAEARVERLEDELTRARADVELLATGRALRGAPAEPIAYSAAMRELMERLRVLADHDVPLLFEAESGVDVEAVARALHIQSGRGAHPLIVVDCATIRERDAEATLFGGVVDESRRPGLLRAAAGGTLLLLDVAALPAEVQRQLAVALASHSARGVDGRDSYSLSARLLTTCRPGVGERTTGAADDAGGLDPELMARLSATLLRVPPLRERADDVESLALLAVDRACRRHGCPVFGFTPEAIDALKSHPFPGNAVELELVIGHAVSRCRGERIAVADLALGEGAVVPSKDLDGSLEEVERRALAHALARAHGNKSEAARLLGLARTTFLDKLRRHKLDDGTRDSQLPPN